jgi:predicted metal-dependent peptidase
VFPGTQVEHKLKLAVAVDESGSISDELLTMFFSELSKINLVSPEIWLIHFDADVAHFEKFTKYQKMEAHCRGGTDFDPPIRKAEKLGVDAMVLLTDGGAPTDPEHLKPAKIPVLWALEGNDYENFQTPFGLKIKLEPDKKAKM